MISNGTKRPDTPVESVLREWYSSNQKDKDLQDKMEHAVFPEDVLIEEMAKQLEEGLHKKGYEITRNMNCTCWRCMGLEKDPYEEPNNQ